MQERRETFGYLALGRGRGKKAADAWSAAVSNVRRIQRYLQTKSKAETAQQVAPDADKCTQEQAEGSFLAFARTTLAALCGLARPKLLAVGC